MRCSVCGEEHAVLDPTFRRPDPVAELSDDERQRRVKESDDLCAIRTEGDSEGDRYFVRCVLLVEVHDRPEPAWWGLWAEVDKPTFRTIVENWTAAEQGQLPALSATIANTVPGYPSTLGLPAKLMMTAPTTRPTLEFPRDLDHPFAADTQNGVTASRVHEWLQTMEHGA